MRTFIISILSILSIGLYAADLTMSTTPDATMQSVNNASYMSSGSTYSSAVYEVGSGSPFSSPSRGPRKSPPGKDDGSYNPANPQFSPLGDALFPLLLMALAYMVIRVRRKRQVADN